MKIQWVYFLNHTASPPPRFSLSNNNTNKQIRTLQNDRKNWRSNLHRIQIRMQLQRHGAPLSLAPGASTKETNKIERMGSGCGCRCGCGCGPTTEPAIIIKQSKKQQQKQKNLQPHRLDAPPLAVSLARSPGLILHQWLPTVLLYHLVSVCGAFWRHGRPFFFFAPAAPTCIF